MWSDLQRAEERINSDRDKNVMVKLLVGYPTKKVTQTCQEVSNLRRESVKGKDDCWVQLGWA